MNTARLKEGFLTAVDEATKNGARLSAISDVTGVSVRSIQRWRKELRPDMRKGSARHIPHKLTEEERQRIIDVSCSVEFRDCYPPEIVAKLAEKGLYIASEASFYRVLKQEQMLSHRRKSRAPVRREKPRLTATGPNQVYSWDITWLKTNVAGQYFYLYLVLDIFSRMIVHWEIHESESSEKAAAMLQKISARRVVRGLTLHSDNGAPMKGYSMLAMMQALNVTPSFSRPRVSTDNPYSESLFRTIKYRYSFPKQFSGIEEATIWMKGFVYWYNREHLHSGISFVTPHDRHYGKDDLILRKRRATYQKAYEKHPNRWSREPKSWDRKEFVYINPVEGDRELEKAS